MHRPSLALAPFMDGRGAAAPTTERSKSAGTKREREAHRIEHEISSRNEVYTLSAGTTTVDLERPLVAVMHTQLRDRDLGVQSVALRNVATRHALSSARHSHSVARQPHQQMEAAHRAGPLHPQCKSGNDGSENLSGNRFGGTELCDACGQPHTDANYVATDANGISYCGDCWDAELGVTIITQCAVISGAHMCACGNDLREEQWFAVECTPSQKAFCQACCLGFWGITNADMVVTAIQDRQPDRLELERGAHLRSSSNTPNDDASPSAGLSDRGFSPGQGPNLLGGCMNLSPQPGELVLPVMHAHMQCTRAHAHAHTRTTARRTGGHAWCRELTRDRFATTEAQGAWLLATRRSTAARRAAPSGARHPTGTRAAAGVVHERLAMRHGTPRGACQAPPRPAHNVDVRERRGHTMCDAAGGRIPPTRCRGSYTAHPKGDMCSRQLADCVHQHGC